MVRNFFEPLKDEISEIIAPPKRALVVIDEASGEVAEAADPEDSAPGDPPEAAPVNPDGVLRAIPVEPLDVEGELGLEPGTLEPQPLRALPVDEDDLPGGPGENGDFEPTEND